MGMWEWEERNANVALLAPDNSLFKFPLLSDLRYPTYPNKSTLAPPTETHTMWSRNMKVLGDSLIPWLIHTPFLHLLIHCRE